MHRNYLLLLLLFISSAWVFAQNSYLHQGDKLMRNFLFTDAAAMYKKVADKDANDVVALEKLGTAYLMSGQNDSAEIVYQRLSNHVLAKPINKFYYAQVLRNNGKYQQADTAYKAFALAAPGDVRSAEFNTFYEDVKPLMVDSKIYELSALPQNTAASEMGVAYHNHKLMFASNRGVGYGIKLADNFTGKGYYDLYETGIDSSEPVKLKGKINKLYNEGPATFTRNGLEMIFTATVRGGAGRDGIRKLGLYHAVMDTLKKEWRDVQPLPFNSHTYNVAHPSLSKDGTQLYFASDMSNTLGETDIYMVTKGDTSWSKPVNLGAGINTPGKEMFPFIADDGTLYFSSDSRVGLGGLDIYSATNQNGQWGNVQNLGAIANSIADDFGYISDETAHHGYLVSDRTGGAGSDDVYSFNRIADVVSGTVTDAQTGEPKDNVKLQIVSDKGEDRIILSNAKGNFTLSLKPDRVYKIEANKAGYQTYRSRITAEEFTTGRMNISLQPVNEAEELKYKTDSMVRAADSLRNSKYKNLVSAVTKMGFKPAQAIIPDTGNAVKDDALVFELRNIYFDLGSTEIKSGAAEELDKVAEVMKAFPGLVVALSAHTDSRGNAQDNMLLSTQRAQACVNYLVSKGINRSQLVAIGYGEELIRNKCKDGVPCTEEEHAVNRRTEVRVLKFE